MFPLVCQSKTALRTLQGSFDQNAQLQFNRVHTEYLNEAKAHCKEAADEMERNYLILTRKINRLIGRINQGSREIRDVNGTYSTNHQIRKRSLLKMAGILSTLGSLPLRIGNYFSQKRVNRHQDERLKQVESQLMEHSEFLTTEQQLSLQTQVEIDDLRRELGYLQKQLEERHMLAIVKEQVQQAAYKTVSLGQSIQTELTEIEQLVQALLNNQVPPVAYYVLDKLQQIGIVTSGTLIPDTAGVPAMILDSGEPGIFNLLLSYLGIEDSFDLYELHSLPAFAPRHNLMRLRRLPFQYVAIDNKQEYFMALTHTQAEQCSHTACELRNVQQRVTEDVCGIASILDIKPRPECATEESAIAPVFISTDHGIIYALPHEVKGHLACKIDRVAGPDRIYRLKHQGILRLPPACDLYTHKKPSLKFVGPAEELLGKIKLMKIDDLLHEVYPSEADFELIEPFEPRPDSVVWPLHIQRLTVESEQAKAQRIGLIVFIVVVATLLLIIAGFSAFNGHKAYRYIQGNKKDVRKQIKEVVTQLGGLAKQAPPLRDIYDRLVRMVDRLTDIQEHESEWRMQNKEQEEYELLAHPATILPTSLVQEEMAQERSGWQATQKPPLLPKPVPSQVSKVLQTLQRETGTSTFKRGHELPRHRTPPLGGSQLASGGTASTSRPSSTITGEPGTDPDPFGLGAIRSGGHSVCTTTTSCSSSSAV